MMAFIHLASSRQPISLNPRVRPLIGCGELLLQARQSRID